MDIEGIYSTQASRTTTIPALDETRHSNPPQVAGSHPSPSFISSLETLIIDVSVIQIVFLFKMRDLTASCIVIAGRLILHSLELGVLFWVAVIKSVSYLIGKTQEIQSNEDSVELNFLNIRKTYWHGGNLSYDSHDSHKQLVVGDKDYTRLLKKLQESLVAKETSILQPQALNDLHVELPNIESAHEQVSTVSPSKLIDQDSTTERFYRYKQKLRENTLIHHHAKRWNARN